MTFIEIRNLRKRFGAVHALSGIDIGVDEREFVTFLGPSGCGKTTTLRVLAGFLEPDEGTISVAGKLLSSPGNVVPPERRRTGMVFQNYAVWPHMSVFDNVAFGLMVAKRPRAKSACVSTRSSPPLASKGLGGAIRASLVAASSSAWRSPVLLWSSRRSCSSMSPFEPRRQAARAHANGAEGLQRRTGITFVYVTHDQAEAMALSDRIAVFHKGTVQQVGSPREVYERPANLFVADFMGLVNKLAGTLIERRDDHATVQVGSHVVKAVPAPSLGAAGAAAIVAIRPEAIAFYAKAGSDPVNEFVGTIPKRRSSATSWTISLTSVGSRCGSRETGVICARSAQRCS